MAETYGWGPNEVNDLTTFQLAVYLKAITPEHCKYKLTPEQAINVLGPQRSKELGLI